MYPGQVGQGLFTAQSRSNLSRVASQHRDSGSSDVADWRNQFFGRQSRTSRWVWGGLRSHCFTAHSHVDGQRSCNRRGKQVLSILSQWRAVDADSWAHILLC